MEEITFQGDIYKLNQCENIWQWYIDSKVYEFTYFFSQVVFHTPTGIYAAYKDNLDNLFKV